MSKLKTFNAILMITGTSVGTGILGLPIVTSDAGITPSLIAFMLSWFFMTAAALHILEIKMQVRGNYNLSSMIRITLGKAGQTFSSIIILLLLYALLCTYVMACSAWFHVLLLDFFVLPQFVIALILLSLFAIIIYCGERFIYNINNMLAFGLIMGFIITICASILPPNYDFLSQSNIKCIFPALPLLLTTFGFSIIVPAVTEYLEYDESSVRFAILLGGIIALVAYIVWEWVILGHIPLYGKNSFQILKAAGDNGTGVILSFAATTKSHLSAISGRMFAIFAAVTSFMGVSIALLHFLADNLKIKADGRRRILLLFLIYVPPLIIISLIPNAFVQVLSFAGLFVAILLGLFPVLMVYSERRKKYGKIFKDSKSLYLLLTGVFFLAVIIQELVNLFG